MLGKTNGWILAGVLIIVLLSFSCAAEVVVFDDYKTTYRMDGGTLYIEKNLRIKNVGSSPIIPGEIHFKISQKDGDESIAPSIANFDVIDKHNKRLDAKQVKKDGEMDLVFTIWDPLLPKFYYDFTMRYEMAFDPKGLIFYEINIPEERTTIPIRRAETEFIIPGRYFVTYAPDAEVEKGEGKVVRWDSSSNLKFEYSFLPMPRFSFPMVNVFWVLLILLLLAIFVFRVMRSKR